MKLSVRNLLAIVAAIGFAPLPSFAQDAVPSQYGCSQYEFGTSLPAVEGKDGVFYRTFADLRMQHPMDNRVVAQMERLAKALKAQGTTLVFAGIPPKSLAMPELLPERAADYGFERDVAEAVYTDIIDRLSARGILAPDIMTALRKPTGSDERPLFGSDFHWTSAGARLAAQAIGAMIKADPRYNDLTHRSYETRETGVMSSFSSMRLALQAFCVDALPPVETMTYETVEVAGNNTVLDIGLDTPEATDAADGTVDIFGESAAKAPDIVLVGTSFSDSNVNNFAGFLQEYTGLEVVNYAITGGNQFGSMTSYLSSREFRDARPKYLIWESPIYNNLALYGPAPMEELIFLADSDCDPALSTTTGADNALEATFDGAGPGPKDVVYIDFGGEGPRHINVTLTSQSGLRRESRMGRDDRLRATGRFVLWLQPYWSPDISTISVKFDRPLGQKASLSVCHNPKGNDL